VNKLLRLDSTNPPSSSTVTNQCHHGRMGNVIGDLLAGLGTLLGGVAAILALALRKDGTGRRISVKPRAHRPLPKGPARLDAARRWVSCAAAGACAVFALAVLVVIDGATASHPASATIWWRLATEIVGVLSLSAGAYGALLASHEHNDSHEYNGGAVRGRVSNLAEYVVLAAATSFIAIIGMAILG
jgi:protein-S-isoprenylcysteine O-methyltransferase Ste14